VEERPEIDVDVERGCGGHMGCEVMAGWSKSSFEAGGAPAGRPYWGTRVGRQ
jgi:hypothetical protein